LEHNRDELLIMLHSLYRQLSHVQQEQWRLLGEPEINWDVMSSLLEQWHELSRTAEGVVSDEQMVAWQQDQSNAPLLQEMNDMLREMMQRSTAIEDRIREDQAKASGDMQEIKTHQTVLHAYGGLDRPNMASIYFDEKK